MTDWSAVNSEYELTDEERFWASLTPEQRIAVEGTPTNDEEDVLKADWLTLQGKLDPEDYELQIRLTRSRRRAEERAGRDWDNLMKRRDCRIGCTLDHIHVRNGVCYMTRTVPFERRVRRGNEQS